MGQSEIIQALAIERKINNDSYLTTKEIQKALQNIGFIARITTINKNLLGIRKTNIIEVNVKNERFKSYRLKSKYKHLF